jgi:hypothetical protein
MDTKMCVPTVAFLLDANNSRDVKCPSAVKDSSVRFRRLASIAWVLVWIAVTWSGSTAGVYGTDPIGEERKESLSVQSMLVDGIVLQPRVVDIQSATRWQTVTLQARLKNGLLGAEIPSAQIRWKVTNPEVAKFENGRVVPLKDGLTSLVAQWISPDGVGYVDAVAVRITQADKPAEWEFKHHVQAVLARAGCNSGACHGALAGKGGFRLSLRGYDSIADHFTMVMQDRGRRVELADPAKSLLLTKPSEVVPHKGGLKLPAGSDNYRVLAEWIAAGAPVEPATPVKLEKIEVLPGRVLMRKGESQQVVVLAHYDNGRVEDVTHWAKFSASDESVCQVDENGKVTILGHGEGAIVVWYASRLMLSRITVPFPNDVGESQYAVLANGSPIDRLVAQQLRELRLPPSPLCSDSEFVRRAFLDTLGVLPNATEVKQYMESSEPNKKEKLIDHLLSRPEFVDYWAYKWSDILMINGTLLRPDAIKAYYQWVRNSVEKNVPWDQFVYEIITAKGNSLDQGATNFYSLSQDPETMTENACQAFLALSIGCAKCHNHPLEKWTNDQYYAMANLFARVRAKGWGGDSRNGDGKRTLVVLERGDLIQPSTGKPQPPAPLDAPALDANLTSDRREYLAQWMTVPENPYFTKAIVNRVWANFFGIGLVQPVDDLRVSNPASNPELFELLSNYVAEEKYDLKKLMKLILLSNTYALQSNTVSGNEQDRKFFSHYYPKRLMAEVMHDAICQVTSVPTKFEQIEFPGSDFAKTEFYPEGTRAVQLYDSAVRSYFLKTFGRNQRRIVCECERSDESSVVQVLHLSNGTTVNEKLAAHKSVVGQWLSENRGANQIVEDAYWRTISRSPSDGERARFVQELEAAPAEERRQVVEDLFWALLSSREFLFNH